MRLFTVIIVRNSSDHDPSRHPLREFTVLAEDGDAARAVASDGIPAEDIVAIGTTDHGERMFVEHHKGIPWPVSDVKNLMERSAKEKGTTWTLFGHL